MCKSLGNGIRDFMFGFYGSGVRVLVNWLF